MRQRAAEMGISDMRYILGAVLAAAAVAGIVIFWPEIVHFYVDAWLYVEHGARGVLS